MNDNELLINELRVIEDNYASLFSKQIAFNDNLIKMEDNVVYDKYDHNQFIPINLIEAHDLKEAITYQKDKNLNFLKIDSRTKVNAELVKEFELEESTTLTMLLNEEIIDWDENLSLTYKDLKFEDFGEALINLELKHYKEAYGESFCVRNIKQMIETTLKDERLHYFGAFIGDELVGACFAFADQNYVMVDSLLVDDGNRHSLIGTSLLKYVVNFFEGKKVFLHADEDDTPKEMYFKLGFDAYDVLYEYYKEI